MNPRPLPYQGSALPLSHNGKKVKKKPTVIVADTKTTGINERKNRIELSSSAWKAEVIATIRLPQMWAVMDSNHSRPKPADLQSAPFSHSGNYPKEEPLAGIEPATY